MDWLFQLDWSVPFYGLVALLAGSALFAIILLLYRRNTPGYILSSFTQGDGGYYYNPPTLVNDHIYIGTSRKRELALAQENFFFKLDKYLEKVWEYPLDTKEVRGGATLDSDGNIYFLVEDGRLQDQPYSYNSTLYLYSLSNPDDPAIEAPVLRWGSPLQISTSVWWMGMTNPAIIVDDIIYVGGDKVYAFDKDGNEIGSSVDSYTNFMNAPIIDPEGNIYFSANGGVVCLEPPNIQGHMIEKWAKTFPGQSSMSSPAFSTDHSKIYVGVGQTLYCFNTNQASPAAEELWAYTPQDISGDIRSTPAVDDNNNVYFGTKENVNSKFYAIHADGSGLLWDAAIEIGADIYSSPALGNNNTVYFGSEYSNGGIRFYALDMADGTIKWSVSLSADVIWSSPALSDQGILYIATKVVENLEGFLAPGIVYAIKSDSTGLLADAGSPRFHGGNANTGTT